MDELSSILGPKAILPVLVIAFANVAVVTSIKQALNKSGDVGTRILNHPLWRFGIELLQPILGGLSAAVPGVFNDDLLSKPMQVMIGVVAGFMSPMLYRRVLKQVMPDVVLPANHPDRAPNPDCPTPDRESK